MNTENLPLLDLFTQIRQHNLSIGIAEYQRLLRALQAGFGIADRAALKRLCLLVWSKSLEDQKLIGTLFEHMMPLSLEVEVPKQTTTLQPDEEDSMPTTVTYANWTFPIDDDMHVAQAVLQPASVEQLVEHRAFLQSDEYFPITRRHMIQLWRSWRRPTPAGSLIEVDIGATIQHIAREGMLLESVMKARRVNRIGLLLLVDQDGSMVPFHMLSRRLVETACTKGRLEQTSVYYFHNVPASHVYRGPLYQDAVSVRMLLQRVRRSHASSLLICSDAGAARGRFNVERIQAIQAFLKQASARFRSVAWVNPLPAERWSATAAEAVRQHVPMFEISRKGLAQALRVLRGQSIAAVRQR